MSKRKCVGGVVVESQGREHDSLLVAKKGSEYHISSKSVRGYIDIGEGFRARDDDRGLMGLPLDVERLVLASAPETRLSLHLATDPYTTYFPFHGRVKLLPMVDRYYEGGDFELDDRDSIRACAVVLDGNGEFRFHSVQRPDLWVAWRA